MARAASARRMKGVSIKNLTRRHHEVVAGLPFEKIAEEVLPDWEISLVFIGPAKARALNKKLRNKTYTPQVLSYALGAKSGEIFICLAEAKKQAPEHEMSEKNFILSLFIHGALHIKGWEHSGTMEKCEQKLLAPYVATHSRRH